MPRKPLDVVVLGGSFAGLSVAHHFLDNIIHQLSTFEGAPTYRIVLVSPSTHLYWNICAPRAAVSPHLINEEAVFVPIEPAFSRHPFTEFNFMQGSAVVVDASARKVKVKVVKKDSTKRLSALSKASSSTAAPESPMLPRKIDGRSNTHNRNSGTQTISYHALIIATGTSSHSPLFKLHGTHEDTLTELRQFHQKLESARSIMIVGGGPSGVETAGQLATYYNRGTTRRKREGLRTSSKTETPWVARIHKVFVPLSNKRDSNVSSRVAIPREGELETRKRNSGLCQKSAQADATPPPPPPPIQTTASNPRVPRTPKTITLLSGGQRLLSRLPMAVSNKAETKLEKLGVHVVHQVRELSHMQNPNGTASTILNSDMTVTSDLLISATGVTPNTTFLPKAFLNEDGYITADRETLRVYGQGIGDRVYAIGDCASYSRKYLADVYEAVPILMKNLHNDLLSHEYRLQTTTATPNMNIKTLAKSASEPLLGMREGGRWEYEPLSRTMTSPLREEFAPSSPAKGHRGRERGRPPSPTLAASPPLPAPQTLGSSQMEGEMRLHLSFPAPLVPRNPLKPLLNTKDKLRSMSRNSLNQVSNQPPSAPIVRDPLLTPTQAHQKISALEDALYVRRDKETVLMPITRFGGTGVVRGWRVPGWVVYVLKGRDYAVSKARSAVERGRG